MDQERENYVDRDLPPPSKVGVCLIVGAVASLLTFVGGIATTVLIQRSIPPEVANPTEFEGFGDYVDAVFRLIIGVVVSVIAAVAAGIIVSFRMADRLSRHRSDPPAR